MRWSVLAILLTTSAAGLVAVAPAADATGGPSLSVTGRACPGRSVSVTGAGFADGSYLMHASAGSLSSSELTASAGTLHPALTLTLPVNFAESVTITATDQSASVPDVSAVVSRAEPVIDRGSRMLLWQEPVSLDCFAAGEQVAVHVVTSPATTVPVVSTPTRVSADATGKVNIVCQLRPGSQPTAASVYFTGQSSTQSAGTDLYQVPGSALLAGQSLVDNGPQPSELMTPLLGYDMLMFLGQLQITRESANGDSQVTYDGGSRTQTGYGSRLTLQTDGNLVIFSPGGAPVWSSGTSGTGSNNRLVMQQDGNLVLSTSAGTALWSSSVGLVGSAGNLRTFGYVSSSRPSHYLYRNGSFVLQAGSAVYINGLIKQASPAGALIRAAGRQVYLQRYLQGHWQNMLVRTSSATGQLSVGFIQTTVYQYRLLVLRSASAAAATSASTFR